MFSLSYVFLPALDGSFQPMQSDSVVLVVLLVMKAFLFWMVLGKLTSVHPFPLPAELTHLVILLLEDLKDTELSEKEMG